MITVEVFIFWFIKKFVSYYSDAWSNEEEISQFMRTNEICDEVTKIVNSVSINFYCLRYF